MKYRIIEKAEVMRVYDIDAEDKDDALDIMYSGKVDPISVNEDGENIEIEEIESVNKYGVPVHIYELLLEDKQTIYVDVAEEEDWGNIQHCTIEDCDDWKNSIGYGDDADGHRKIISVKDQEDGSVWDGNSAIMDWYKNRVACYVENYSA